MKTLKAANWAQLMRKLRAAALALSLAVAVAATTGGDTGDDTSSSSTSVPKRAIICDDCTTTYASWSS